MSTPKPYSATYELEKAALIDALFRKQLGILPESETSQVVYALRILGDTQESYTVFCGEYMTWVAQSVRFMKLGIKELYQEALVLSAVAFEALCDVVREKELAAAVAGNAEEVAQIAKISELFQGTPETLHENADEGIYTSLRAYYSSTGILMLKQHVIKAMRAQFGEILH